MEVGVAAARTERERAVRTASLENMLYVVFAQELLSICESCLLQ